MANDEAERVARERELAVLETAAKVEEKRMESGAPVARPTRGT